ncbi:hypothetical protein [Streptomyces oceani]|nr:hypothetical protein [Streptomyces oceani]
MGRQVEHPVSPQGKVTAIHTLTRSSGLRATGR